MTTTLSFHPYAFGETIKSLVAIAGQELPQKKVKLDDPDFQALFLGRHVYLGLEEVWSHNKYAYLTSEVTAIEAAPQPTPPAEKTHTTKEKNDDRE